MRSTPEASLARIRDFSAAIGRPVRIMEVCGTHTQAVGRGGLRSLLPADVELVSGPGCPVCVTSQSDIERMLILARRPDISICTFGDMIRVPGIESSLERERSEGADIRVVYSAYDAMDAAIAEPDRQFVFLAVGFETTAPGVASVVLEARRRDIANLSFFVSHKLIPPAMEAVLEGGAGIDGFMTPGHVSVVLGSRAYDEVAARYGVPCVATGFDPQDILEGIGMLLDCVASGRAGSYIQYARAVHPDGNPRARQIMYDAYEVADADWRGIGVLPGSGLRLRGELVSFDACLRFRVPEVAPVEIPGCRCGEVLKGLLSPPECPLFGRRCTPQTPVGPCMVSTEGSCATRYRYG